MNASGLGSSPNLPCHSVRYRRCWRAPAALHLTVLTLRDHAARRPRALEVTNHAAQLPDCNLSWYSPGLGGTRERNPIAIRKRRHGRLGRLIGGRGRQVSPASLRPRVGPRIENLQFGRRAPRPAAFELHTNWGGEVLRLGWPVTSRTYAMETTSRAGVTRLPIGNVGQFLVAFRSHTVRAPTDHGMAGYVECIERLDTVRALWDVSITVASIPAPAHPKLSAAVPATSNQALAIGSSKLTSEHELRITPEERGFRCLAHG